MNRTVSDSRAFYILLKAIVINLGIQRLLYGYAFLLSKKLNKYKICVVEINALIFFATH